MQHMQANTMFWNGLLKASGGALNPPKCIWAHFQWKTSKHSNLTLQNNDQPQEADDKTPHLYLSSWWKTPSRLKWLWANEAHRYLGIQITMDGNSSQEMQIMIACTNKYCKLLNTCSFTRCEACMIYQQCFLPAIGYPLLATFMPNKQLNATQCTINSLFLSRFGYPCTMPRAVTHAPTTHGGIGMHKLSNEQVSRSACKSSNTCGHKPQPGQLISILIHHYRIMETNLWRYMQNTVECSPMDWQCMAIPTTSQRRDHPTKSMDTTNALAGLLMHPIDASWMT